MYEPKTNVLWIDYLCDKLLHHKKYAKASSNRAEHSTVRKEFQQLRRDIESFNSASSLVSSYPFFDCQ